MRKVVARLLASKNGTDCPKVTWRSWGGASKSERCSAPRARASPQTWEGQEEADPPSQRALGAAKRGGVLSEEEAYSPSAADAGSGAHMHVCWLGERAWVWGPIVWKDQCRL